MKSKNNERGGTLVIVLLLVAVFTMLGVGLLSMNISASKQFDKKEEQVQARHLAEMGLIHYKSIMQKEIKNHTLVIGNNETKEEALERSRNELCEILLNIDKPFSYYTTKSYLTNNKGVCGESSDGGLLFEFSSEGKSNETLKLINGTASFIPPNIIEDENETIPGKPHLPDDEDLHPDLPDESSLDVLVNGPVVTKKETHDYGGSLVINKAPSGITFKVDGGKQYNLTIAKDFYIGGDFHSQNHSCIIVKRDLTILGKNDLGNKTTIVVYGNAYFEEEPELQNKHSQVYVAGNTFVGNPAVKTTDYKSIPSFSDCPRPEDFELPYEPEMPSANIYQWKLEDKLNPDYVR